MFKIHLCIQNVVARIPNSFQGSDFQAICWCSVNIANNFERLFVLNRYINSVNSCLEWLQIENIFSWDSWDITLATMILAWSSLLWLLWLTFDKSRYNITRFCTISKVKLRTDSEIMKNMTAFRGALWEKWPRDTGSVLYSGFSSQSWFSNQHKMSLENFDQ